jgi:L-gulonolactone oxidase
VEIRVCPADDVPLSTAYGRDSVYLAFHTNAQTDHTDYFGGVEAILRAHDGRPHWGKLHTRTAADLAPAYPRWEEFQALREKLDPDGIFTNPYLDRVLGPRVG